MDYQRIYDQIIDQAKQRKLEGYKERHHIIPKCMGGTDDRGNLVELTAREHYICHRLLVRIHPNNSKLIRAFWGMSNQKNKGRDCKVTSKAYAESKELFSRIQSESMLGDKNPQYGRSPWNKGIVALKSSNEKRSVAMSGENHFMFGKHHKPETIQKMKKPKTKEHKEALSGPREPYGSQPKIVCPHCNKKGGNSGMKRWHFENCTQREL